MATKIFGADENGVIPKRVREALAKSSELNAAIDGRVVAHHLILGWGQSNMTQGDASLPSEVVDERLRKYNRDTGQYEVLSASETYTLPAFAREYVRTLPRGHRVVIVPSAVGSTAFTEGTVGGVTYSWDRTNTTASVNLYARAVADAKAAMAVANAVAGATNTYDAILWSQGEGDTPWLTESAYAAKFS